MRPGSRLSDTRSTAVTPPKRLRTRSTSRMGGISVVRAGSAANGAGGIPVDHAASSRKGPRDSSLALRQRAEDTGPRGMPPAPLAAASRRTAARRHSLDGAGEVVLLLEDAEDAPR